MAENDVRGCGAAVVFLYTRSFSVDRTPGKPVLYAEFGSNSTHKENYTPSSGAYDLRNVGGKNFATPVKNQGGCGSCVTFGTAAVLETTYKRSRNNPNPITSHCHSKPCAHRHPQGDAGYPTYTHTYPQSIPDCGT